MTSTYDLLNARLQTAFDSVAPGADPVLRTSERSDYQANGVMALAKRVSRPLATSPMRSWPSVTSRTSPAWKSPVPGSSTSR